MDAEETNSQLLCVRDEVIFELFSFFLSLSSHWSETNGLDAN